MQISVNEINASINKRVKQAIDDVDTHAKSCAVRASNELRNAVQNTLRGQRHGKKYKLPFRKTAYTASAPGEPPARRTGVLRVSWGLYAVGLGKGEYTAGIYTDVPYAHYLDEGTKRMAARPFREATIERATSGVIRIFSEINK